MLKKTLTLGALLLSFTFAHGQAQAGVTISPYVSIKSTKTIKPGAKDKSEENETIAQRQEAGLRGSLTFWRLFGLQLSVGQNKLTTTQKTDVAKDEYGQIDYEKDLHMSTNDPEREIKITETQRNARLGVTFDPSFGIFILRASAGVTATQRILVSQVTGDDEITKTFGPTYKPNSGFGAGVRFSPSMYCMAEYNFYHYAFPKLQPFEREVAVSFALQM